MEAGQRGLAVIKAVGAVHEGGVGSALMRPYRGTTWATAWYGKRNHVT